VVISPSPAPRIRATSSAARSGSTSTRAPCPLSSTPAQEVPWESKAVSSRAVGDQQALLSALRRHASEIAATWPTYRELGWPTRSSSCSRSISRLSCQRPSASRS